MGFSLAKLEKIMVYLRQPSTWQGILFILSSFGVQSDNPFVLVAGVGCGVAIGIISILKDDGKGRKVSKEESINQNSPTEHRETR